MTRQGPGQSLIFCAFSAKKKLHDGKTDQWTNGWTNPLVEILKRVVLMSDDKLGS